MYVFIVALIKYTNDGNKLKIIYTDRKFVIE